MYQPKAIVGDFFEELVMKLFGLSRSDDESEGKVPDLVSKDGSFYVEVKASAYTNGGVINEKQLFRFDREVNTRRFYAFAFHPINRSMKKYYPSEDRLKRALEPKSLFLFPFSIVKAHYKNSKKVETPKHDTYVQLAESKARNIFGLNKAAWEHLTLDKEKYRTAQLHEKVHLITTEGNLEEEIINSFHPEFLS